MLSKLDHLHGLVAGERALEEELNQLKDLLKSVTSKGVLRVALWVQGFQSEEMFNRARLLRMLSTAGLVEIKEQFTHHNAYLEAKITEKGRALSEKLASGGIIGRRSSRARVQPI